LLINRKTRVATVIVLLALPIVLCLFVLGPIVMKFSGSVAPPPRHTANAHVTDYSMPNSPTMVQDAAARASQVASAGSQPPTAKAVPPKPVVEKSAKGPVAAAARPSAKGPGVPPAAAMKAEKPPTESNDAAAKPAEKSVNARPAWAEAPPRSIGDAYQTSIVVGPYTTRQECDAKLPEALQAALDHYVETAIGPDAVGMIQLPVEYLRRNVVVNQWEETRQYSVGPMIRLHAQLQFDAHGKGRVLDAYRQAIVVGRLWAVAAWAAMGLSLLTVCFAYLKLDLATAGVYRGRLRWAAAAAILGLVGVAMIVVS
jgi:hypothetical protein